MLYKGKLAFVKIKQEDKLAGVQYNT